MPTNKIIKQIIEPISNTDPKSPALTKILTLASLQGIADTLTGEGIRFEEFEMKFNNQKNLLVLLESGDEVLNYAETVKYFKGSNIDITFGGSHSYESMANKLEKIVKFLEI